jgi:hypothetical protein
VPRYPIRTLFRGGAAVLLTSLLFAGCGRDIGGRIVRPRDFGDPADLIAWVTVAPQAFRAGEIVQIEVSIRNPTARPIVLTSPGCGIWFAVTRSDTLWYPDYSVDCAHARTYGVAPGDTIAVKASWNGISYGGPRSPGVYWVHSSGFHVPSTVPVPIQILAP